MGKLEETIIIPAKSMNQLRKHIKVYENAYIGTITQLVEHYEYLVNRIINKSFHLESV